MKVVILCGGQGTRLREVTEILPKPLVPIGDKPILWHIMKGYAAHGIKDFILCLGYKGDLIRDFFMQYHYHSTDTIVNLHDGKLLRPNGKRDIEDWTITFVNTGETTNTALRLYQVRKYLENDQYFMLTYGDGVSNVDINHVYDFHRTKNTIGTITGVHPSSKYGEVKADSQGLITSFVEKPVLDESFINGGFMIFTNKMLQHPMLREDIALETVLTDLAEHKQLALYTHKGFWHCMDTPKDFQSLNELWKSGKARWKVW